ncbi:MAG: hypothetical protein ACREDL_21080 [Bradyrhizobium sp.]
MLDQINGGDVLLVARPDRTKRLSIRRTMRCSPVATLAIGSSLRTLNAPSAVSTFEPAHHRATKALASVASRK